MRRRRSRMIGFGTCYACGRDFTAPVPRGTKTKREKRTTDGRRNGAGVRTRKIRSTFMRIVELLPGGLERVDHSFAEALHAILEDVL